MSAIRRYANFWIFLAITVIGTSVMATLVYPARALLIGFDLGAIAFLALIIIRFGDDKADEMRSRAASNEPDHATLTIIAMFIALVVMVAVWVELSSKGGRHGTGIALSSVSLCLAWLFANTLFALHYAHVWYLPLGRGKAAKDAGGLEFPGNDPTPDYWDFAYFAFVLGMTFQVSDVQITNKPMRRLALFHGMLAFLFNIAVVALSVNLMASALGG